jgi:hypothetical protein
VTASTAFGRSIQLFLVDGTPAGLIIASIHGWTGSVLVQLDAVSPTFSLFAFAEVLRDLSKLSKARLVLPSNGNDLALLGTVADPTNRSRTR